MSGPVRGLEVLFYTRVQGCLKSHPQLSLLTTFALSSLAALGLIPCPGAETTGSQLQHQYSIDIDLLCCFIRGKQLH